MLVPPREKWGAWKWQPRVTVFAPPRFPEAVLVAVGPSTCGPCRRLARRCGERQVFHRLSPWRSRAVGLTVSWVLLLLWTTCTGFPGNFQVDSGGEEGPCARGDVTGREQASCGVFCT